MLLYLSEPGIRHKLDGLILDCESVGVLPMATAQDSRKFEPIPRNSNRRLTDVSVACRKNKSHQKMRVNPETEDFFVGRRCSKMYTL